MLPWILGGVICSFYSIVATSQVDCVRNLTGTDGNLYKLATQGFSIGPDSVTKRLY